MLAVPVAVVLRATRAAPTATVARAPVLPLPRPKTPSPPATGERFSILLAQGLEKAQQGALAEAAERFTEALELRPTDAETWNSLGVVLVRQGQTARGVDAFTHALRVDPNHPEAHRNLAVVLDRQGRSEAAAAHYRAFLRLGREDHPARDGVRRRLDQISAAGSEASGAWNETSVSEPQ